MGRTDPRAGIQDAAACLAVAAALLVRASDLTWAQARSNPDPQLRFRGIGLDLAASRALELLPADPRHKCDDDMGEDDPLELMRSVEEVLRRCPLEDFPAGTAQLVLAVCDLIGEHIP